MHDLPLTGFGPEDTRDPQGHAGDLVAAADLRLVPLDLDEVRKFRSHPLREDIEANDLAVSIEGCGALIAADACSHPRTGEPKGFASVTSSS